MQQGEIWWADLAAPIGRRPVVIVSSAGALRASPTTVVVARITARIRQTACEVPLGAEDGLPKTAINAEMLHTIPRSDLVNRIACLSPQKLSRLEQALSHALGLDQPPASRPRLPVSAKRVHFGGSLGRRVR